MLDRNRITPAFGCLLLLVCCACRQSVALPRLQLDARQLTQSDSAAEDPSIMQAADGSIWIAWIEKDDTGKIHLWYKRTADGESWTEPFQITKGQPGEHYYPSLLQQSDGKICIAWFSGCSGNADIWFSDSADGIEWSAPQQVTRDPSWDWAPSLMQASDGKLWLAWASGRAGNKDIWVAYRKDEKTWSPPRRLTVNGPDNDDFPCLSRDGGGGFLLSWTRSDFKEGQAWDAPFADATTEIYLARSQDATKWTAPQRVTEDRVVDVLSYQCPADTQGSNLLLWTSSAADPYGDIVGALFAGRRRSETIQLTAKITPDYSPRVLLARDGKYWLAWASKRSGTLNVWYATFEASDLAAFPLKANNDNH